MEDYGPRPMLVAARSDRRGARARRRLDLRRPAQGGRARVPARADGDHRPAADPPRAHGLDLAPHHGRGDARELRRGRRDLRAGSSTARSSAKKIVATSPGGSKLEATFDPVDQVAEDLRHHLDVEVGQPSGRRGPDRARARRRRLRRRRRRRRLPLRPLRRPAGQPALRHDREQPDRGRPLRPRRTSSGDFLAYTSTDENSNRVGEFAIGTNIAVHDVIGNILQDEKLPTLHVAFGHPYAEHTGAKWKSTTHIDIVGRQLRRLVRRRPDHGRRPVPHIDPVRPADTIPARP